MTSPQRNQGKPLSSRTQKLIHAASIVGAVLTVVFIIWAYKKGLFTSKEVLSEYMQRAGFWGPPLFILLQILQTVVPIIPGALTSIAGVYIYGEWVGNIYNYIGIIIGSIIAFALARKYGQLFVKSIVSKRTYDRYIGWLDKENRFDYFFIFMMLFPVSPDDFLCMLAALTKMTYKKFIIIILLCKPVTLAAYTYGMTFIIDTIWSHFSR
ncbi:TVP38/TMEM64 family protein [Granulicatella seriolae]|uniref:TVP38/TMEM64 family membrane protein n=1 Tax=Granulicatella seriolae TaxID=2967226 RepID=A0ABT1WLV6_9LACT|nr:TVP38/TMEM64 family protein [Granulicatella seriolae]